MQQSDRTSALARQLLGIYTGGVLTKLIVIGYRTGLFEGAAAGPGTCDELSARAGLHERYVREWLGAMTTAGIFDYDPASRSYELPPEHALLLTGPGARNLAPHARMIEHFGRHLPALIECFHQGGGVPYAEFRPEFTECMDDTWRRIYDEWLIDGFLGAVDGVPERLASAMRVLDIGCGSGHALNVMAQAYPASRLVGYDIAGDAIRDAQREAAALGLTNVRFEVRDVTALPDAAPFDLITAFDAIHDQREPQAVLRSVHRALAPDGTFLMIEFKFASELEDNLKNPFAPLYYGISLMHCTTVSLAAGGPGLGAVWGERIAREMLAEAGFARVDVLDTPRPQNCLFVCRKQPRSSSDAASAPPARFTPPIA